MKKLNYQSKELKLNNKASGDILKEISLLSYAKINLSLDVLGIREDGFHLVEMIMHQIELHDEVLLEYSKLKSNCTEASKISIRTNSKFVPDGPSNLAYKAAALMLSEFPEISPCKINIRIKKHIPVSAGLAGGSSNCAAVIHAINNLCGLHLSLNRLCELGASLGSDVPFCILGQAASNEKLYQDFKDDKNITTCALSSGTGTTLSPLPSFDTYLCLSKPSIAVSTAEVYKGIDNIDIPKHPNTTFLIELLSKNPDDTVFDKISKNLVNVLENYTLSSYPIVEKTKNKMQKLSATNAVLMSGSGPSVFALCKTENEAKLIHKSMVGMNHETFVTKTTRRPYEHYT